MSAALKVILLLLLFSAIVGGIAILPDASDHPFPQYLSDSIIYFYSVLTSINFLIPIFHIITVMLLSITLEIGIFAWRLVQWLIGLIKRLTA